MLFYLLEVEKGSVEFLIIQDIAFQQENVMKNGNLYKINDKTLYFEITGKRANTIQIIYVN